MNVTPDSLEQFCRYCTLLSRLRMQGHESVFGRFTRESSGGLPVAGAAVARRGGAIHREPLVCGQAIAAPAHERHGGGQAVERRADSVPGRGGASAARGLGGPAARRHAGRAAGPSRDRARAARVREHGLADVGKFVSETGLHLAFARRYGRAPGRAVRRPGRSPARGHPRHARRGLDGQRPGSRHEPGRGPEPGQLRGLPRVGARPHARARRRGFAQQPARAPRRGHGRARRSPLGQVYGRGSAPAPYGSNQKAITLAPRLSPDSLSNSRQPSALPAYFLVARGSMPAANLLIYSLL